MAYAAPSAVPLMPLPSVQIKPKTDAIANTVAKPDAAETTAALVVLQSIPMNSITDKKLEKKLRTLQKKLRLAVSEIQDVQTWKQQTRTEGEIERRFQELAMMHSLGANAFDTTPYPSAYFSADQSRPSLTAR